MKGTHNRQKQTMVSEKMGVFHSLRNWLEGWFHTNVPEDELIDYIVNIIEPKLKQVRRYRQRLKEPLEICREHCRTMVADIPGPIALKRNGRGSDPFIRAAFTNSELLEDLLDRADETKSQAPLSGTDRVALLTMTSSERTIFGRKQVGNMMIADAAMRAVTFTDHTIVGLSTTLESSKKALEMYSLDILAEAAARQLSEVRTRLVDLGQRQERLRAMGKMFGQGTGTSMGCVFVPYDPDK